jgi:hypothetical protein
MRVHLRLPLAIAGLALGGVSCGGRGPGGVELDVRRDAAIAGVAQYDVHVFGGAVSCSDIDSDPAHYVAVSRLCGPSEEETSSDCHLVHAILAPGSTARLADVRAGTRAVFAVAKGAQNENLGRGCRAAVVAEGKVTSVTISVTAGGF